MADVSKPILVKIWHMKMNVVKENFRKRNSVTILVIPLPLAFLKSSLILEQLGTCTLKKYYLNKLDTLGNEAQVQ